MKSVIKWLGPEGMAFVRGHGKAANFSRFQHADRGRRVSEGDGDLAGHHRGVEIGAAFIRDVLERGVGAQVEQFAGELEGIDAGAPFAAADIHGVEFP